nr:PAS domain S-box protein [Bacillus ectoiniformans]
MLVKFSLEQLEWFFQVSTDIFMAVDQEGNIQYVNPSWERTMGYANEEIAGLPFLEQVCREEKDHVWNQFLKIQRGTAALPLTSCWITKSGEQCWLEWQASWCTESGIVYGIAKDVTEEKKLLEEAKLTDQYYRALFKYTRDAVDILDANGCVIEVNQAFEHLYGWTLEELKGKRLPILPTHLAHEVNLLMKEIKRGGSVTNYETIRQRKDGALVFVALTVTPLYDQTGELIAYSAITRDISKKKVAELREKSKQQQLLEGKLKAEQIVESITDGFFVLDRDWRFVYVSEWLQRLWNRKQAELHGEVIWSLFSESVRPIYEDHYRHVMESGEKLTFQVYSDELNRYYELCVYPYKGGITVYIRDIHEQQVAVQQLKESEGRFRQIANNINEVFCLHTTDGSEIIYVNPVFEKVWGFPVEEVYRCPALILETVHPDDRELMADFLMNPEKNNWEIEYRIVRRDGATRWLRTRSYAVADEDRMVKRKVGVSEDITEIKEKEALLRKWDKLSAAGYMAAGMAHEIRNPLTVVKGFTQLLSYETTENYTSVIISEIERIEEIIEEFLKLSKPQEDVKYTLGAINETLKETIHLLQPEALLNTIQFIEEYDSDLPLVSFNSGQMKQVFLNIIKNAIEATGHQGTVHIQTGQKDDQTIFMRIVDDGIGINNERLPYLGEPFYSNKEKGTGLGLMVSFNIIKNHRGKIHVTSKEGEGTTVEILLPVMK